MLDFLRKNKKEVLIPSAVLLVICVVIPLALALTNRLTADRIAALEAKNREEAMARLIDAEEYTAEKYEDQFEYFVAKQGGEEVGYIFVTAQKGYGGEVSVMTAIKPDGAIKAVAILDVSNETPGLGQNAAKENFYGQFADKTNGISLLKNGANADQNEINAVTGATITSTAVTRAVNAATEEFEKIRSVENHGE